MQDNKKYPQNIFEELREIKESSPEMGEDSVSNQTYSEPTRTTFLDRKRRYLQIAFNSTRDLDL